MKLFQMICHTAADPEAYPELPSEVDLPFLFWLSCKYFTSLSGGQLHGPLSIGASSFLSPAQILNLLLCDHRLQGGQHQDRAAHVPQENPWIQARQHQMHGLGECFMNCRFQKNCDCLLGNLFDILYDDDVDLGGQVDQWKKMSHSNLVTLRQVFTSKSFGDHSMVFVYDFFPGSETLMSR